jgi:phospholipid/cholesterol/gamma-HCH transport system permease protein
MFNMFNYLTKRIRIFFEGFGQYLILLSQVFRSFDVWHSYIPNTIDQMIVVGSRSIPIVILTSLSSGMVACVQGAYQMTTTLVPKWYLGGIVGNGVFLELAPLITGLVLAGRIGANIAAEIGTMRVTEQIDALEILSLDPVGYLLFPRIIAGTLMFPVLIVIADFFGILGGLIICVTTLDMNVYQFLKGLRSWFNPWDPIFGLIKSIHFGFAITSIACYFGYFTKGGAEGVGKSTTSTVVASCITILVLNYFLAEILL